METIIYHITTKKEWDTAVAQGFYEAASVAIESFMHCSTDKQVDGVLQRYFAGKTDLVKLTIDVSKVQARLQYDFSPSVNEMFPHIYGRLNLDAVIATSII